MTLLCELCRVVVIGKDGQCENPCIFQEYFDSITFDLMIQHYGDDLLMSVIKDRHEANSRDLEWNLDPDTNLPDLGSDSDLDQDSNLPPDDPVREATDLSSFSIRAPV
uniref:Uncharacterized protein n=1 Tax=Solanum tuberosum TaxID=4113 RepID=M1DQF1_SOLTU